MKKLSTCLCILAALLLNTSTLHAQTIFPPTNTNILVMGRYLITDEGNISFDWPAVTIDAYFTGTSVSIMMDDTKKNYYNVFIDDVQVKVISVDSDQTILLAEGLENAPHKLKLTKRTEGEQGMATFKGLIIDDGHDLLPLNIDAGPKIEFIGNSITCGYGVEAANGSEHFLPETENSYQSYASVIARAFRAEYHMISHSGLGVVRNYGDKKQTSGYSMPDRYLQVFDEAKEPLWDFSVWIPDAVVINLGTNDFSTEPHPNKAVFNKKYNELIAFIRKEYGEVPIFCIAGPMIDEPCYTYVKNMVDGNRSFLGDNNIYFVGVPTYLLNRESDYGADWHPNYSGQIKIANHIIPVISSVTGWKNKTIDNQQ